MVERNFRSPWKGLRELTIGIASTEDLEIAISYVKKLEMADDIRELHTVDENGS